MFLMYRLNFKVCNIGGKLQFDNIYIVRSSGLVKLVAMQVLVLGVL